MSGDRPGVASPLWVLDWRRRVGALYAEVRACGDPRVAHDRWRSERDDLFARHPASPLVPERRAAFDGLRYAPYDAALRFTVDVDLDVPGRTLEVVTGTDGTVRFGQVGRVELASLGTLDLWWLEQYGGGLFVPLRDPHPDTYGGGRYVVDTAKGADLGGGLDVGSLVVDLNFAYNPSCAYDPAWACPLAPPENRLEAPVAAGELYDSDG